MTSVSTPLSPSDVSMVCCGNTQGGSDWLCSLYSTSVHAPEGGTRQLGLKAPDLSPQCCEDEHLSAHLFKARVQRAGKWVKAGAACLSYQACTCGPFIHNPDPTSCLDHYLAHQGVGRCLHLSLGIVNGRERFQGARGSVFSSLPGSLHFIITSLPLPVSVCRCEASSALGEPEPASPSIPLLPLLSASPLLVLGVMDM